MAQRNMKRSKDEMIDDLVAELGDYQGIARDASGACYQLIERLELLIVLPNRTQEFKQWAAQITMHAQTVIDSVEKQVGR